MKKKSGCWLIILCMLISLAGCGKQETALITGSGETVSQSSEMAAVTVNDEEISLREWNFYVRMNQMQWEKEELEDEGDEMWSQEVDEEGTTLEESLKEQVLDTLIQTHIMNQHAEEYQVSLTEEETDKLKDPGLSEEDYRREGICYVLISTTGLRDEDGNLTPFTAEEVAERTALAEMLAQKSRAEGSLKIEAEAEGLTPIESSMGAENGFDGQEPLMLDAARRLEVGEISDPVETEEGWFIVQHTSDYDEDGTEYWKEYLTEQAKEEECSRIYEEWKGAADITFHQDVLDRVEVKTVMKDLL